MVDLDKIGLVAQDKTPTIFRVGGQHAVITWPAAICQGNRAGPGRKYRRSFRQVEIEGESHRVVVVGRAAADALVRIIESRVSLHHRIHFTHRPRQLVENWYGTDAGDRDGQDEEKDHRTCAGDGDARLPHGQGLSSEVSRSSIRRWISSAFSSQPNTQTVAMPSKETSRRVENNSSHAMSPLPISLCWWIRASTPGGLMM